MYLVAMVLPFGAWLLIAFLQFRLLRSYFRRPRLWMVATLAGGIVGNVAAGFAQLHSPSAIDNAIMNGEDASAWASFDFLSTPVLFGVIPALTAVTINLTLYGVFMCMKGLLIRRARRQEQMLAAQFD